MEIVDTSHRDLYQRLLFDLKIVELKTSEFGHRFSYNFKKLKIVEK